MSVSESTVRTRLRRKGYALCRSRSRTPEHLDYGRYHIFDPYTNIVVAGYGFSSHELDLEEADDWSRTLEKNWRLQ